MHTHKCGHMFQDSSTRNQLPHGWICQKSSGKQLQWRSWNFYFKNPQLHLGKYLVRCFEMLWALLSISGCIANIIDCTNNCKVFILRVTGWSLPGAFSTKYLYKHWDCCSAPGLAPWEAVWWIKPLDCAQPSFLFCRQSLGGILLSPVQHGWDVNLSSKELFAGLSYLPM